MITSNPNSPTFVLDDLPFHWQMTRCEKFAFSALVQQAMPGVAIEIGTYQGGSLQVISKHAEKVYSIDISDGCQELLGGQLTNVEFLVGKSSQLLPDLLRQIQARNEPLGFVLIDGDHTSEGVRADIDFVLQYKPTRPLYVVMHDSFNPECRNGITSAAWARCPHVHFVEVDFVPGVYHAEQFDTAPAKSMYGGLAVALLRPETRSTEEPLVIHQSQRGLFETMLLHSCHAPKSGLRRLWPFY
jgi:hypothetical protein